MHVYRSMVQCEVVPCGVLYISRWCLVCCSVLCVRGLQYVAVRFGAVWCSLHIALVSCVLQCAVCTWVAVCCSEVWCRVVFTAYHVGVLCVAVCCVSRWCLVCCSVLCACVLQYIAVWFGAVRCFARIVCRRIVQHLIYLGA